MAEAPIIVVVDNLAVFLNAAETRTRHPLFAAQGDPTTGGRPALAVNVYDDPDRIQYPLIDIHPARETPLGYDEHGRIAETALCALEFVLTLHAPQYGTAVRQAFAIAEELRRCLNTNRAAKACGVDWIRREEVEQAEPEKEMGRTFITLQGRIRASYSIEAK